MAQNLIFYGFVPINSAMIRSVPWAICHISTPNIDRLVAEGVAFITGIFTKSNLHTQSGKFPDRTLSQYTYTSTATGMVGSQSIRD